MSAIARRAAGIALAAGLLASVAACSSSGGASSTDAAADSENSIILITPNPIGSNNFLQLAADGAKEAGEKYDASVDVYESEDPTSIQQNIDAAIREKPSIIIGVTFSVLDQFTEAAADNPDQQFLLIDTSAENPTDNLTAAVFKEYEATYLTGVEAGLLTEANSVGVVASLDTPFIHRWVDPFFAGAESVDPGVKTAAQYVGGDNPFGDQARAKAQAQILADGGADYVQAASSGGNIGIFEAAAESGFKAFGVDTNQCLDSPGNVVDNAIKRVDVALVNSVGDILDGKTGGFTAYGLAEGGVGLTGLEDDAADSKCLIVDHPDVLEQVKKVRDQIVSGEITVTDPLTAG
ncbi:BMP family ABC transporter substrate-binding protein [Herbiconiux sp. UC225_62]|uniref:BMP family ABC transporter substrate-binding protein n=1 Tax=Herbiconiux sp. UC225_62 TaxID=3350168 RepID=UPI0036D3BA1F